MVFKNTCGAMDIAPSATKVKVTSSIWKRRTDACSLSWPIVPVVMYAPSCDWYGVRPTSRLLFEMTTNEGVAVSPRQSLCRNMARIVLVQFAYRGEVFLLTGLLSGCEPMEVRGASRGRVSW